MPGTFTCEHCGAQFQRPHLNRAHRYCSRPCHASARTGTANSNWRGGMVDHPLYSAHRGMVERCTYPGHKDYSSYGGRGITVCDRWTGRDGFWNFVTDMGPRPEGHSIDRIDNDLGYSPDNCRWADAHTQRVNQRRMTRKAS